MVTYLTIDSSVIVAALREQEEKHEICKRLLERVKNGEFVALEPCTVLVEVVAAIKRRTGSEYLAERVKSGLENIDSINFLDLISIRADDAANIAKETGVRGMDAIVIQIAKEFGSPRVSLDMEMAGRSRFIVDIVDIEDAMKL
ncbi:MAG: type II toxin-antitoxin system VapC family toxin [Euryarchaeota archaeon]|nr:type II toxin-antitoxin system VapC family toxin [Euryarchaeota archaeon]